MHIQPFKLERYFALYEFKVRYLLSPSDCESLTLQELLGMAGEESRQLWEGLSLGYTESPGHPALRAEIAALYPGMSADDVLVAAPEELIYIYMHSQLQAGDRVVTVFPAYQSLSEIGRAIGCEVVPWPLQRSPTGWRLDLEQLASLLARPTRLLVLNFPHNPTGFQPTRAELQAIVDLARRSGTPIFGDEMYRGLEYDPADQLPSICEIYENGTALSGLSKAYALPGLRIGWLCTAQRQIIEQALAFKDYTTICNSAPSEVLGIIALQARERIQGRNRAIVQTNLQAAQRFFEAHVDQLEWLQPGAGSIAFPRYRGPGAVEQLCQRALDEQGVMLVPGSLFDFPGDYFRLGLGRKLLPEGLQRLEAVLGG